MTEVILFKNEEEQEVVLHPNLSFGRIGVIISDTLNHEVRIVRMDKQQAIRLASALLLATFEPEIFSEEKVEEGARMILGES